MTRETIMQLLSDNAEKQRNAERESHAQKVKSARAAHQSLRDMPEPHKVAAIENIARCATCGDGIFAEYGEGRNTMARTMKRGDKLDCVDFEQIERAEMSAQFKMWCVLIALICFAVAAVKL